jgi:hypothetical protein
VAQDHRKRNTGKPSSNKRKALVGTLRAILSGYSAPEGLLYNVASDLYESLNTPISLSCEILLRYGELEQLVRMSVLPQNYLTASSFADDSQAVSFMKKVPLRIAGVDPEAAAKEKFLAAELACKETNARIRTFVAAPLGVSGAISRVISTAIAKIHSVLGDRPDSREWLYACRFGPGTFNHTETRGLTSLYDKLQVRPSVTPDMTAVAALLVMSQPQWAKSITDCETEGFWPIVCESDFALTPGNRVAFVPKTTVTHRSIAIEPLMNIFAQLGLGTVMRRKLKRVGIDLDDQTPNQRAAKVGSLTDSLATIDLSSASDTVARELVRLLLPEGWFSCLDLVRSKIGLYEGEWLVYEKFSSMGNGYTFELETLIFWGLMVGVCTELDIDTSVLVYGDDIVVPVAAYSLAEQVLTWSGFTLNKQKSFWQGPFRESCGKDYFNGVEVRPFFQKEIPNEVETLFRLANGIRQVASRRNNRDGCDRRLLAPWQRVVRALPRLVAQACRVPAHAGSSDGLKCNWDESQVSPFVVPNKHGWEGVFGVRYQSTPLEGAQPFNLLGVVATQLYRLHDGGKIESQLLGLPREGWIRWLAEARELASASPRQERGCTYRLREGAFYGPWTDFGEWR